MSGLAAILALGFFLGMRHATDPDHVIAISTIVSNHRSARGAAIIGAAWGLGHTLTVMLVGGAIILFRWVIPPRVGLSMELAVAVVLIALGVANVVSVVRRIRTSVSRAKPTHVHSHAHSHGDYVHTHPHGHAPESHPHRPDQTPVNWLDRHFGALGPYRLVRPFVVGIVHGLAGSAAVTLLVLASIQRSSWSLLYLGVFGVGTIAGMMLITAAISVPFVITGAQFASMNRGLRAAAGLLSVGFGLFLAYRVGVVDGLFTNSPRWTPH
jgi:ABC-type nickel/cobalt efflux system permease component RcnA